MTARHNHGRNFPSFRLGLNSSRGPMGQLAGANDTENFREFWVTVTFEGSHIEGLRWTLAKASNKEVK